MKDILSLGKRLFRNDFLIAFLVLVVFLLTNRYVYGWDDQHLEIPLLKHLIDPQLYAGDYYVEALSRHFSTYLFPILARFITVDMIPTVYLGLYVIVRFFFFYWVFRLWYWISRDRITALLATLSLFLLGRTEEFIYRTFSHEEFSFAIIFAGFFFFYRERLILAAILMGIAANFHALYALFPMLFLTAYALFFVRDRGKTFLLTGLAFTICALPFILWHIPQAASLARIPVPASEWVPLYLLACPQCFPLGNGNPEDVIKGVGDLIQRLYPYLFLILLYAGHCVFNVDFRRDKKAHVIFWVSTVFVGASFFFAYVIPNRFVLDLNLTRFAEFLHFFLIGYTVLFLMQVARRKNVVWTLLAVILVALIGWADAPGLLGKVLRYWWILAAAGISCGLLFWQRSSPKADLFRKAVFAVPFAGMIIVYLILHFNYVQIMEKGGGFWQLQRNWEDMQRYVRDHTPKEATILTPYDMEMGGFRIHSNRKVVVCYRDCGVIGFDFKAAQEWQQRVKDVEAFKVMTRGDIRSALINAIGKYKADYIVFMNYYAPGEGTAFLKREYGNEVFSLYHVAR
ncbi:MAG: hypothetical protein HQL18_00055 [Candidatus Omnitrophica bacterium]|nr:hypothetical protein [Candidatus Omnitrophota bacterium]